MDNHSHDHKIGPERRFWSRNETLVSLISGGLFFLGLLFEFYLTNPTLELVFSLRITVAHVFLLSAMVIGSLYTARRGVRALLSLSMSVDFLISTALIGALILGKFVEAAALAFLYGVAELMEDYSMIKARSSLRELLELSPEEATVRRDGEERTVPSRDVGEGETVLVRPGEKVPLDGTVTDGSSRVNEAPVTGESRPAEKNPGDPVYAGTLNQNGYLEFTVTSTSDETTLARIVSLIEEAESSKAPAQRFVDRFTAWYTPLVVLGALFLGLVVPFVPGIPGDFATWWLRAMALLVIACPCGLIISTPVTVVSGITSAARHGTLIKGGRPFELMGRMDVICFDKTGTLTEGNPAVEEIIPLADVPEPELLRLAAAVEARSEHHLGKAIVRQAEEQNLTLPEASDFESVTGTGVRARVNGSLTQVGKPSLFDGPEPDSYRRYEQQGKTVVCVGNEQTILGVIVIGDRIREEAKPTVRRLKERGMQVVMITGDNEGTARVVAEQLGIDHYHAELLPEDKVDEVKTLRERHGSIAMVGDGVNDAPALAAADVGIAMGAAGTDTALETADIALLGDDLSRLTYLIRISRSGEGIIKQNITASIAVKLLLGIGVIPGWVTLITAVLVGDMGVSLGITANAMRLRRIRDDGGPPIR